MGGDSMLLSLNIYNSKNMLVPRRPSLEGFEDFEKMFDRMGNKSLINGSPAIDIYEKGNSIIVEAPLIGIDPKNVEISIENEILTIQGRMEKKSEVEDQNYYRREIRSGSFYRQIPLPKLVIGDKASAVCEDGLLKVVVPKAPEGNSKKIAVKIITKKK